ncbi:MAG: CDP-alcohol phosphatidyltransferase family protein [Ginsengibacter sp.]
MSWYTEYKKSLKMTEIEEFFDLFFYRPLAFLLVKIVYPTKVTPNQLTITAIFIGLASGFVYATGLPNSLIYGALLFMFYNVFDCSDGMLARLKKNGTPIGRIIDGIADYVSTAAVFIGLGIGYPDHSYHHSIWWLLLFLAALSNVIQSIMVDYYRNRFLDYVLQRKSTFEEEMDSFREEYNTIKDQKSKWLDRWIIRRYFGYSAFQEKLTSKKEGEKLFKATPEEYYKKNKSIAKIWVNIGPTAQITAIMICSIINRFDIYFWLIIGVFNAVAIIAWIVQRNIDKTFIPKDKK